MPARPDLTQPPTGGAVAAAGRIAGLAFGAVSRVRAAKSLHPSGVTFDATLRVDGGDRAPAGATLLATPGEHPAVVRFSRSLGLPQLLPDLFGAAIRLPDVHGPGRHQDLLFVTSVDAPVLHHVFVAVTDAQQAPYSSSLPYESGGRHFVLGLRPVAASPRPGGGSIEDKLMRAAKTGKLTFELVLAPILGRFARVGELRVGARRGDELNDMAFNPWNTGGGLRPAGFLNGMRRFAYPLSQDGWEED